VTGPYARAARLYRELGWQGVLPCDYPAIGMPPPGYTGGKQKPNWGIYPTDNQIEQWITSLGDTSVGLRLPDDVIAIDVDSYDGKDGDETLALQETRYGLLPATWTSTSRGPSTTARKRFYRVPRYAATYGWREPGDGLELLHHGHRWARVWPSINHRTGEVERWYRPDGTVSAEPPSPGELTLLPDAWIEALWSGEAASSRGTRSSAGGDHSGDQGQETFEYRGNPFPIADLFNRPIPPGDQNNLLFAYFSSLRARRWHRTEMINAAMILLQRLVSEPGREPWTAELLIALVDHVIERVPSGPSYPRGDITVSQRGFVDGFTPLEDDDPIFTTDMGNTLRLVSLLGDRLRYAVDEERWYVWDGQRWAPDRVNQALRLTKEVIRDIRNSGMLADGDQRDRLLQWALTSENIARRHAMLTGAEAEPQLAVTVEDLDVDPNLLVVRNGTLDLRTGELRESRREDLCSRLAEVTFDADADCPRWQEHVNLLCNGDPTLVAYIQRAVGYTLTGDVGARSFFFLEGSGSNGKNAFIEPIMMMLGSYAQTATSALLTGGDEQHPTILADLLGTRLVFIDETRQGKALNVERVKALTGSKRVKARRMRKDFFEFDAQFKLWIAGNGQPTIRDSSDGVWNRMHRILCHGKVAPEKRVDRFGDKLYEWEASGILNWALAGLADWRVNGLKQPDSIREDVQSYRDEEDYVGQFLDDVVCKTDDPDDFISSAALYLEYSLWAAQHGLRGPDLLNASHLARQLASHGLERHKQVSNRVQTRGFRGVAFLRDRVG
jgi:putative DNA primase/helicase